MAAIHYITLLYCPFPSLESAQLAAKQLLEQHLVACCNLLPGTESHYWWDGKLTTSEEVVVIAKTTADYSNDAIQLIKHLHPSKCPAILAFSTHSTKEYAAWTKQMLTSEAKL